MDNHETPDTILIQTGEFVTKKRNEKYLKKDASGIWHLNFRVPVRFGGKLIRQCLFTEDFEVAASIRDRFVVPVLSLYSGGSALEEIGKSIIAAEGEAINHLGPLKLEVGRGRPARRSRWRLSPSSSRSGCSKTGVR